MTDIVTRLRRWAIATDAVPASDLMDEAADEIERLRLTDAERTLIGKLTWESEHPKMGRSIWVMPQDRETAHGLLQRLK